MTKIVCAAFVITGLTVIQTSAMAEPAPKNAARVYSSLCWEEGSGDAAGYRIKITGAGKQQSLSIEWSDGPKEGPERASNLTIDLKTERLKFTFQFPAFTSKPYIYSISGRITNDVIILEQWNWGDGQGAVQRHDIIPHVASSDDKIPACKNENS